MLIVLFVFSAGALVWALVYLFRYLFRPEVRLDFGADGKLYASIIIVLVAIAGIGYVQTRAAFTAEAAPIGRPLSFYGRSERMPCLKDSQPSENTSPRVCERAPASSAYAQRQSP